MASPDEHIVDFDEPPVEEVSLMVQFGSPAVGAAEILGDFWPRIRDDYPRLEQHPPLPPLDDSFDVPSRPRLVFNLAGPEETCYRFISEPQTELVQVQSNRLGYNWRRIPATEKYPRYGHSRKRFEKVANEMLAVGGDRLIPTWCEISYLNPIVLTQPGEPRPDLSRVLRRVAAAEFSALPPTPINSTLIERFRIERDDGTPYAWFFVEAHATVTATEALGHQVNLTMRGQPDSPDLPGVLAFFDDGRKRIVETFRDFTTTEMHERWKLS